MRFSERLAVVGLTAISIWLLHFGGVYKSIEDAALQSSENARMRNVSVDKPESAPVMTEEETLPTATPEPTTPPSLPDMPPEPDIICEDIEQPVMSMDEEILETTIAGGLTIKNETSFSVDTAAVLREGTALTLPAGLPQILIIHTHSSEAYTPAGLDRYTASDYFRTEDTEFNIIRIGDEMTDILTQAGLNVIHDRGIYDFPSYTGSYNRSAEAIEEQLKEHPSIAMVIDIHRDALGEDGVVYKTMAEEEGVCASQVMFLVGSSGSGLVHPDWRENLSLALYLQQTVGERYPTLMRPVALVNQRYNQHLTKGSMIVEVGSSGNTLQEALAAVRLLSNSVAPALLDLVK